MPVCWIIAGPNGAGKTTFALEYLPTIAHCDNFINADLIAAGLSPLAPETQLIAASRIFLNEIETRIKKKQDFSFETTLSGRSYLKLIRRLQKDGWQVELIYLALPDVEMSKLRVTERVTHGGHSIPIKDIIRRFPKSLKNLFGDFSNQANRTRCFMNSGDTPVLVFEQINNSRTIIHQSFYEKLLKVTEL